MLVGSPENNNPLPLDGIFMDIIVCIISAVIHWIDVVLFYSECVSMHIYVLFTCFMYLLVTHVHGNIYGIFCHLLCAQKKSLGHVEYLTWSYS